MPTSRAPSRLSWATLHRAIALSVLLAGCSDSGPPDAREEAPPADAEGPAAVEATPTEPEAAGPDDAAAREEGEVAPSPEGDALVTIALAPWVAPWDPTFGQWRVVPTGTPPGEGTAASRSADTLAVPSGRYDVYWKHDVTSPSTLVAEDVNVPSSAVTTVTIAAAVVVEPAAWVPRWDGTYGEWFLAPADADPDEKVQGSRKRDTLPVLPGRYDVYWKHDVTSPSTLVAEDVGVSPGAPTSVPIRAAVAVDPALGLQARNRTYGRWWVVPAGGEPSERIQASRLHDTLPVLPGRYDVYWKRDLDHERELVAQDVAVTDGLVRVGGG